MTTVEKIAELLARIEAERGVRILYACESGSRAWGFASPDSDYDIRFLFARKENDYLSVAFPTDTIEVAIHDDLDPGGWDVRKALGLLGKSNGPLLEWLHSPITYRAEEDFLDRWRAAARDVFSPQHAADHYRGLAKQMTVGKLRGETVRAKDYLYALRAALAADWINAGMGIPPVPFNDLLPVATEEIRALVPSLLEHKVRTGEAEKMPVIPALDDFLAAFLERSGESPAAEKSQEERKKTLDHLFRREISRVKPETAADYTLERVMKPDVLLFDAIAGSHAYGLALPHSDEDRRGVFVASPGLIGGLDTIEQVADGKNDRVYYEVGRLITLLLKNNPAALELIAIPEDCVKFRHPIFEKIRPEMFLSKLCEKTFGNYAMMQVSKARGLNKKIVNPQPEERRTLLSFCHVPVGQGSVPLEEWLKERELRQRDCGITAVRGTSGVFAIYHFPGCRGIVSAKDADSLIFTSVPVEADPIGWMHCNIDAFKAHCKAHREYWQWVGERNEERYTTNTSHGRGYDSKNLMHTIRLLRMAEEIAREGVVSIRRSDRENLLDIRSGKFSYDELVSQAEEMNAGLAALYAASGLPDQPDRYAANCLLVEIRAEFGGD